MRLGRIAEASRTQLPNLVVSQSEKKFAWSGFAPSAMSMIDLASWFGVQDGSSGFHRNVARSAKEVAAAIGIWPPDNLKAMRNGIHVEIPPQFIFCRNVGFAPLSAVRTFQDFNPAIAAHAPYALRTAIVPARKPATIKKTPTTRQFVLL